MDTDIYYQLIDRDTSTITPCWKAFHLIAFTIVIISCFISAYSLGRSIELFGDHCLLYAKISFEERSNDTNNVSMIRQQHYGMRDVPHSLKPIDISKTEWGSVNTCYFCQFTPIMSMICAIIWATFFIICSKGGAGYVTDTIYRPWRIVYPALIFTVISTGVMLASTWKLNAGVHAFCAQFESEFDTTSCTTQIDGYTLAFNERKRHIIVALKLAIYFSYIGFFGWVLQLAVLILRIIHIVDFQIIKITIVPKDEEEKVQRIINPDENSDDLLLSISEKESTDSSESGGRVGLIKKLPIFRRSVPSLKEGNVEPPDLKEQKKPTTPILTHKPSESPSSKRVSFASENLKAQDDSTIPWFGSLEEDHISLNDLSTDESGKTNETEMTSFSLDEDDKKAASSSPAKEGKKKEALDDPTSPQKSISDSASVLNGKDNKEASSPSLVEQDKKKGDLDGPTSSQKPVPSSASVLNDKDNKKAATSSPREQDKKKKDFDGPTSTQKPVPSTSSASNGGVPTSEASTNQHPNEAPNVSSESELGFKENIYKILRKM